MKSQFKNAMLILVQAVAVASLVGCGGGGGGGGGSDAGESPATGSGTASLSWSAPTQNTDGSTLTDLAGYRIYYGTNSGDYSKTVTLNSPYSRTYTINSLPANTYYIVVRAFDTNNNEGPPSAEASKIIR
jgi:hypothetical protein